MWRGEGNLEGEDDLECGGAVYYQIVSKDGKVSVKKDGEVLLTRYPDRKVETSSFLCFESRSGYYPALQALN